MFLFVVNLFLFCFVVDAEKKVLDMSYEYIAGETFYWFENMYMTRTASARNGLQTDGSWYEDFHFCSGEHGGTHIDSPRHCYKDKWTTEEIPLSHLVDLPAVAVDMSQKAKENNVYLVTISDFEAWEDKNGRIPQGGVVFINFGWAQYYPDRTTYLGICNNSKHFPGIHPDAATWLGEKRDIYGVGVDGPSLDNSLVTGLVSHWNFFKKNIWGLEVVARVNKLPVTGARVSVLPMKIKGGSGGPTRVYAVWDTMTSACKPSHYSIVTLIVGCLIIWV